MRSLVCIVAHPDDETITSGGTLSLLTSQGIEAHVICATRGEGGELGDPPVCTREELPTVREAELRCALKALGVTGLTLLNYVDPLIGPDDELFAFEADFRTLTGQLKEQVRKREIDLVLTHGADGEYGHPAHILMHNAVRAAVEATSNPPLLYTFGARVPGMQDHLWNQNEPAHYALDVRPWLDAKAAAMQCHKSQHGLFMRDKKRARTLREATRSVEAYHRQFPLVELGDTPRDDFAELLRVAGAWIPAHD